jgi:Flp pilus assembly protein CpaB
MGRRTLLLITSILVAAVGTALVALYVRSADVRARDEEKRFSVLVAERDISPDETGRDVASTAVRAVDYPASLVPKGAYPGTNEGRNRLARDHGDDKPRTTILANQVVQASMFGKGQDTASRGVTKGQVGVSVQLADPNRVAGIVGPGSMVAVYGIFSEDNKDPLIKLLIPEVTVIGVGSQGVTPVTSTQAPKNAGGQGVAAEVVPNAIVTLSATPAQAMALGLAQSEGELLLALRGEQPDLAGGRLTLSELVK